MDPIPSFHVNKANSLLAPPSFQSERSSLKGERIQEIIIEVKPSNAEEVEQMKVTPQTIQENPELLIQVNELLAQLKQSIPNTYNYFIKQLKVNTEHNCFVFETIEITPTNLEMFEIKIGTLLPNLLFGGSKRALQVISIGISALEPIAGYQARLIYGYPTQLAMGALAYGSQNLIDRALVPGLSWAQEKAYEGVKSLVARNISLLKSSSISLEQLEELGLKELSGALKERGYPQDAKIRMIFDGFNPDIEDAEDSAVFKDQEGAFEKLGATIGYHTANGACLTINGVYYTMTWVVSPQQLMNSAICGAAMMVLPLSTAGVISYLALNVCLNVGEKYLLPYLPFCIQDPIRFVGDKAGDCLKETSTKIGDFLGRQCDSLLSSTYRESTLLSSQINTLGLSESSSEAFDFTDWVILKSENSFEAIDDITDWVLLTNDGSYQNSAEDSTPVVKNWYIIELFQKVKSKITSS